MASTRTDVKKGVNMSTVKKCDRCKKIVDDYSDMKEITAKTYVNPFLTSEKYVDHFDICRSCYSKMFSFEFMEQPLDQMDEALKEV